LGGKGPEKQEEKEGEDGTKGLKPWKTIWATE